jgi:PAS domain S-box-containing protein
MTTPSVDPAVWLAAIVESSDDAIVSKTVDGQIMSWNASAERLYGYTAVEAIGQSILLIVPKERWHEEHRILELIAGGNRVEHFETERQAKDGRLIAVSLTISPVRDPNGRVVGASKVARDITDRKAAEAALNEAHRRKDEFLAMLGHELRNPLAPILSAADMICRKTTTLPDVAPLCALLTRQVNHMVRLLDDLLDVARIASGKIQLRLEQVDLRTVLSRAVEIARPAVDAGAHTLNLSVPGTPVWVQGDATRLVQMLGNLIQNAAKYTPCEGTIGVRVAAISEDKVQMTVVDNGVGISAKALDDVFELFVQGDRTLDRSNGGLGIGLTLVRHIAALHAGRVSAASDGEGRGSTFVITLPKTSGPPREEKGASSLATPAPAAPPGRARRVVVVDDNVDGVFVQG